MTGRTLAALAFSSCSATSSAHASRPRARRPVAGRRLAPVLACAQV